MQYVFVAGPASEVRKAWTERFNDAHDLGDVRVIPAMGGCFLVLLQASAAHHIWASLYRLSLHKRQASALRNLQQFKAEFETTATAIPPTRSPNPWLSEATAVSDQVVIS